MAKYQQRIQARELRSKGVSVKTIAKELGVAKSTASLWVRDIVLSTNQLEQLRRQKIEGGEKGRLLGSLKQKNARIERVRQGKILGEKLLGTFSKKEFFTAGIALYWAEGNKRMKKIEFCNSDPNLVVFMINWFKLFYGLKIQDFRCYVGINAIHRARNDVVRTYWSKITHIPLSQFTKTSFKKSKPHKIYENFNDHFGTLSVRVVKPSRIVYNILGLIDALKLKSQGSSVVVAHAS